MADEPIVNHYTERVIKGPGGCHTAVKSMCKDIVSIIEVLLKTSSRWRLHKNNWYTWWVWCWDRWKPTHSVFRSTEFFKFKLKRLFRWVVLFAVNLQFPLNSIICWWERSIILNVKTFIIDNLQYWFHYHFPFYCYHTYSIRSSNIACLKV